MMKMTCGMLFMSFTNSVFSGLKVNKTKAHAMWPGSNKNRTDTFFGFNWKKKLKILGVYFCSYKCASHIDENWSERIVKIKRLGKRHLAVVGKICIIKTFLISQVMQALVVPENDLIEINRLLFRFWWRKKDCNRRAFKNVKRSVLCTDVESGGFNMIDLKDIQAAFLLQWVCKYAR